MARMTCREHEIPCELIWRLSISPVTGSSPARAIELHPSSFLERFDRQREGIANAALGLNQTRFTGIGLQFTPQPQHLDIDAAIENIFVDSGSLQQMLPRERPLRRFEKSQQQRIFALAQRDRH